MNREQADTELKEQCLTQSEPRQTTAPASIAEAGAAVCWQTWPSASHGGINTSTSVPLDGSNAMVDSVGGGPRVP